MVLSSAALVMIFQLQRFPLWNHFIFIIGSPFLLRRFFWLLMRSPHIISWTDELSAHSDNFPPIPHSRRHIYRFKCDSILWILPFRSGVFVKDWRFVSIFIYAHRGETLEYKSILHWISFKVPLNKYAPKQRKDHRIDRIPHRYFNICKNSGELA